MVGEPLPTPMVLPVGTHRLHEDVSINFQLARWIAWTGGDALADIAAIATQLTDYDEVDATASCQPAAAASRAMRAIPGRAGIAPAATRAV